MVTWYCSVDTLFLLVSIDHNIDVYFKEKEKTNTSNKHNCQVSQGIFNLTFCMQQVGHASAVADYSTSTGHNIKSVDHFEILAIG